MPTKAHFNTPHAGKYFTGIASANKITVTDAKGAAIKDGYTLKETVTADGGTKQDSIVQNPTEVIPDADGTFTDMVGVGEHTDRPLDPRNNEKDREKVSSIFGSYLTQPFTSNSTQKLEVSVPGCGVVLSGTSKHSVSNVDDKGNLRGPGTWPTNVKNNYVIRVTGGTGAVKVTDPRAPK